jgi:hypothetical protein
MELCFFSIFGSSGPGSPQNAKKSTQNDGHTDNNVIEPPILLKYPFHQDDDDEKAFSGLMPHTPLSSKAAAGKQFFGIEIFYFLVVLSHWNPFSSSLPLSLSQHSLTSGILVQFK